METTQPSLGLPQISPKIVKTTNGHPTPAPSIYKKHTIVYQFPRRVSEKYYLIDFVL